MENLLFADIWILIGGIGLSIIVILSLIFLVFKRMFKTEIVCTSGIVMSISLHKSPTLVQPNLVNGSKWKVLNSPSTLGGKFEHELKIRPQGKSKEECIFVKVSDTLWKETNSLSTIKQETSVVIHYRKYVFSGELRAEKIIPSLKKAI